LTIGDLRDGRRWWRSRAWGGGLGLAVGDLRYCGLRSLRLAIGDLGDLGVFGIAFAFAVFDHDGHDVDGKALVADGLAVEVVEFAGQALVEERGALERQRVVAAEGEAVDVEGTVLDGAVELKSVGFG